MLHVNCLFNKSHTFEAIVSMYDRITFDQLLCSGGHRGAERGTLMIPSHPSSDTGFNALQTNFSFWNSVNCLNNILTAKKCKSCHQGGII
jgi:hypothetical protein